MTKVLAKRLEKVIDKLVHQNQSGFIKDRFIGEGIRFNEDIIVYTNSLSKESLILQIDF